jgi:hypothetical protein
MNILVEVQVYNEYGNSDVSAAKIELSDAAIKRIFQLAKNTPQHGTTQIFDYTPELGTADLGIEFYLDMDKLSKKDLQQVIFKKAGEDVRLDAVQLNVDKTSFWWEGYFKHTNIKWETRIMPLDFLPQPAKKPVKATTPAADLNMTAEQMNAIHEKIARGISHGLNAREIEATFNRHVTKAQLIRCMIELIERSH